MENENKKNTQQKKKQQMKWVGKRKQKYIK